MTVALKSERSWTADEFLATDLGVKFFGVEVGDCRERFAGGVEVLFGEEAGDLFVEARDDRVFADVDGLGVPLLSDRVLRGELAPVVRPSVVP